MRLDMMIGLEFLWYVCVLTASINQDKVLQHVHSEIEVQLIFTVFLWLCRYRHTLTHVQNPDKVRLHG